MRLGESLESYKSYMITLGSYDHTWDSLRRDA